MDAYINRKISRLEDRVDELQQAITLLYHYIDNNTVASKGLGKSKLKRQLDIIKDLGKYKYSNFGPL